MKHLWIILLCATSFTVFAQSEYTYFSDRRFFSPEDLVGYQFVPRVMEIPRESKKTLKAGEVTFGITGKNLYVKGEGIEGVYNINSIDSPQYGYQLVLMNPRNPASKGTLKVILTKGAFVDALIFKKDHDEPEIIFVLPEMTKESRAKVKSYYTDWGELAIDSPEDVWGKTIRPFFKIYQDSKIQEKFNPGDSVRVVFKYKEIVKGKTEEISIASKSNQPVIEKKETVAEISEEKNEKPMESAPEIEESTENNSPFFSSPKPKEEADSGSPFFSSPKPKEENTTGSPFFSTSGEEKEEPKPEPVPTAPVASKEKVDKEVEEVIAKVKEVKNEKRKNAKVKIEQRYSIDLTFREEYKDGTSTLHRLSFPVKKWAEREDENAKPGEEKYQIEFQGEGNKVFYLYLTTERTVTAFEWRNEKWLVRD
ncbi:MAG: hypothetical protein HKN16_01950 [Saprospiraceae bacterium]|nr:hypothetical protein [Saprospiraceae bacterium]